VWSSGVRAAASLKLGRVYDGAGTYDPCIQRKLPRLLAQPDGAIVDAPERDSLVRRLGIPPALAWGFVGLLLFMIGDGVESGYLSPYLISRGFSAADVAWVFTAYGIAAAVAAWFSGALSDVWGPRRVIVIGLCIWVVFEVLFITIGLAYHSVPLLLVTYGLRGFGYPLFAFGFLVWIVVAAPGRGLATAMGWFWFAFTGGLPTLGSALASWAVPRFGEVPTFWIATALVIVGGLVLIVGVREPRGRTRLVPKDEEPVRALAHSVSLIWRNPKTGIGCLVRVINTAPEFGFFVFLPSFFIDTIGFTLVEWLRILSLIFASNIIWNLIFGIVGDRLGWRKTVALCGGLGCTLTTLALYYVPLLHHSFAWAGVVGVLYGATLAGYVPLSALMPSLAPAEKGAALSLLNLGAGASVWVGPALVGLFLKPLGVGGLMWLFAGLYLLSAMLALKLRLPSQEMGADVGVA
jgi:polyol permease family